MYLGKRNLLNPEVYNERRKNEILTDKQGAAFCMFTELEGLIDEQALAAQYFDESGEWLAKKKQGCMLLRKDERFTSEEYRQLSDALRDIARRLTAHADELDAAPDDAL